MPRQSLQCHVESCAGNAHCIAASPLHACASHNLHSSLARAHASHRSVRVQTLVTMGKKARDRTLSIDEMSGGTFTISNGGVYGSLLSTPIINPPQSAIMGMHSINQRAMVVDGKIEARPIMNIALTYDHRLIDGREVRCPLWP